MDNSLNDDPYREAYATFSTEHIQQKEALMDVIANSPIPHSQFPDQPPSSLWQRIHRRSWILIAATAVVVVLATFLPSLLEITPASVLADGWYREYVIADQDNEAATEKTGKPKIEVWTEDDWLIVRRTSADDEVEWQVVLAKSNAAKEPKVTQSSDNFDVTFGPYSIQESSSGELKVVRQRKLGNDRWPSLQLSNGKMMNTCGNWSGNRLVGCEIDSWVWVTGGLNNDDQRDVWLRLSRIGKTRESSGASSGFWKLNFFYGDYTTSDDGKMFRAERMMITNENSKSE